MNKVLCAATVFGGIIGGACLCGAIEWQTMRDAKDALYDIDPNIVVYGEPWRGSGGSTESQAGKDARLLEITNYIYANYKDVTLDDLAEKFFLSKPYLSKYIKEKSGMTFGDILKKIRMKKARAMLKGSNATVESIAESVGYQNVEHFNRVFKKMYNLTPVQYRNRK